MSNLSQFLGGASTAKVGDIVEIYSEDKIIVDGGKTYLKGGSEIAATDYPNYPRTKVNKLSSSRRNAARAKAETASTNYLGGSIDTDGNGVWVFFSEVDKSIWRSEDNGITWTCVFVFNTYTGTSYTVYTSLDYTGPWFSNNYIGTWVLRTYFNTSAQWGHIYSEDNGKSWQVAPFYKWLPTVGGPMYIKPYTRELFIARSDNSVNPYIYYSPDFGKTWRPLTAGGGSTIFQPHNRLATFTPTNEFSIILLETTNWYVGLHTNDVLTRGAYDAVVSSVADGLSSVVYDSLGYMYLGGLNFARRNKVAGNYSAVTASTNDISATLGFGASSIIHFIARPDSPIVYAANTGGGAQCYGFKVTTDGGTTWSAERRYSGIGGRMPFPGYAGAMGRDGKIIGYGFGSYDQSTSSFGSYRRLSDIRVLANAVTSQNSTNLFPSLNRLEKINASSFLAYSGRDLCLYRGFESNAALIPIYDPGNVSIFQMASDELGANIVIADGTTGVIRFSNNNLFTNGTINITNYLSSPACNIFVDSASITQNSAESGFSYSTQESTIYYLGFNSDGDKMYVMGTSNANLYQYTLSTAWNPSTATYDNRFLNVRSREATPYAGYFKPDGTQFYTVGLGENVHQWTLTTAWNVSTASYNTHCNISSVVAFAVTGITFSPNGIFMYINSTGDNRIINYKLSEAWNVASANGSRFYSLSTELNATINDGTSITFSSDGRRLYYSTNRILYEMGLKDPYDITSIAPGSTVNYRGTPFVFNETVSIVSFIKPDGKRIFVSGHAHDNVYSYEMNTSPNLPPIRTVASGDAFADSISDICYSNGVFVAVSAGGIVIRSTDYGKTWDRRFVTPLLNRSSSYVNRYNGPDYPIKIKMSSNGTAILVSMYETYRSIDYGNTFTLISSSTGTKEPVKIVTNNNGIWAYANYGDDLLFSYDDGLTWKSVPNPQIKLSAASTLTQDLSKSNLVTLEVEYISPNCWATIFGDLNASWSNTYVYVSKDDGYTWYQPTTDTECNTSSRLVSCNGTLFISSNVAGQGGVQSIRDTIGLKIYNPNQYLRVE